MFRPTSNPFDEFVVKATDENLTSENWEYILDVCDKVNAKPEDGPRDVIAAVIKRLAHRNANVQLYSLTLAESLDKNCGTKVHREIASKPFTQAILHLTNDRTTHSTVKSRAYELVTQWTEEFKNDPSLGIMGETLRQLKESNPSIQPPSRPSKREITDADRKKEEDELQMALALSLSDMQLSQPSTSQFKGKGPQQQYPQPQPQPMQKPQTTAATVSRVKALYDFTPSEPSELPFRRGDIISVLDSVYKDWWRGSLRGQVGIFPVNYVEILRDASPEELMHEVEEEAKILAEGRNIEKLLGMLANADGGRGVDDEELLRLYNTTLAIRPKLVRLIEKYSMRKDELIALNEKFHKARHDYDVLMESSMSRYSKPAPAPSTNPFGQQPPFPPPINRPQSGPGSGSANANRPQTSQGYPAGSPSSAYPPTANWDSYPQAKPWEAPAPPPAQSNPWEGQNPAPQDNVSQQWENSYQTWDQDRPGVPSTYSSGPPQPPPAQHYGGGLDELASPIDKPPQQPQQPQQSWYDSQTGNASQYNPPASLQTANAGLGGFTSPPSNYFSPAPPPGPSKPDTRPDQSYSYSQPPDQPSYPPPPPPSQQSPGVPFEQKSQLPPYPVGKGQTPLYNSPKPPATYNPQAQGDRYASLRSLTPASNQEGSGGWYPSSPTQERREDDAKGAADSGNGRYYGVGA